MLSCLQNPSVSDRNRKFRHCNANNLQTTDINYNLHLLQFTTLMSHNSFRFLFRIMYHRFGYLFGFVGLLLAVPMAGAVGVLTRFALKQYLASPLYLGQRWTTRK